MKLTKDEKEELKGFMENPFYREVVGNAPSGKCRDYITYGLIHGLYGGFDPEICRESLEDGLTLEDWKYIREKLADNSPYLLKCVTRIRELSGD